MLRRNRGSSLVLVVVVMAIALGIILTCLTETEAVVRYAGVSSRQAKVRYAAEAGLMYICDQIAHPMKAMPAQPSPGYNGATNLWLQAVRDASGNWKPLFSTSPLTPTIYMRGGLSDPDIPVYVWLKDVNGPGDDYSLAAYAEYPKGGSYGNPIEDRVQLFMDLRESVGFSTYMFFTFNDDLYMGSVSIKGSVHSNKNLIFPANPGHADIFGNATAHGSFVNPANATVTGTEKAGVPQVGKPANSQVTNHYQTAMLSPNPTASSPAATGSRFYNFQKGANGGTMWQGLSGSKINLDITIHNTTTPPTMDITATGSSGGSTTVRNVDLPPAGVLYTDGNVTIRSADGTFTGNMSVVSGTGTITIDSNLQYKDASGNLANQLQDSSGNPVTPPPTADWGPSGLNLQYAPNPAYSGSNSLGLMALNSILVSDQPTGATNGNLFLNVNTYSQNGRALDAVTLNAGGTGTAKNNLVVSGSMVGNLRALRYGQTVTGSPWYGYSTSALYSFDTNTAATPPPGWLANQTPAFGATYRDSISKAPAFYLVHNNPSNGGVPAYNYYGGP